MDGWMGWLAKKVKKEIEKYGWIWQEHFLLLTLILCDFIYICVCKGQENGIF